MPVFGLCKQRLHPHFPFPPGLLIGFRLVIAPHPFEVAGMERPMHLTTLITRGTLCFEWTRITRGRVGPALCLLPCILHPREVQQLPVWAAITVMLGIIGKLSRTEIGSLVFPLRQGNICPDTLVINCFDVLDGAIFRFAPHLARMHFTTEPHSP